MKKLQLHINPETEQIFKNYPKEVKDKMLNLRSLIIETAEETDGITSLEETLKWGEPAYITKHGSTLRIDWKAKMPDRYAVYFQCTSKLIGTFKTLFNKNFNFEGNRAIVFKIDEEYQRDLLKICIRTALIYHKVKHLPDLGI